MKKLIGLILTAVALLALNGCGGDHYYDDDLTTLFLVDENGNSYGGIPYTCDSMNRWDETRPNGEFSFYPGEDCEFDFYGYEGTDSGRHNELIYIVDYRDDGKNRIPYECELFNVGNINYTSDDGNWDGSFDYDRDDACVFYF